LHGSKPIMTVANHSSAALRHSRNPAFSLWSATLIPIETRNPLHYSLIVRDDPARWTRNRLFA